MKRHGLVEAYRRFGGNGCFHVQGTRVSIHIILPVVGSSFGLVRQWAGTGSTGCLFNLTSVVFRFLPILLHAEWAVILQQVTADTTTTSTFPVLLSNLCQNTPLVSNFFQSPIKMLHNLLCFWLRVTCPVYPTYKSRVHKANVRRPVSGGAPYAAVDANRQFCVLFTVRYTHPQVMW
jgi:uncharacterized membrane protein YqaE (UPF0057 family)